MSRQAVLKEERAQSMGDPIRGVTTPFIESLDIGLPPAIEPTVDVMSNEPISGQSDQPSPSSTDGEKQDLLNYYLTKSELEEALRYSEALTEPLKEKDRATADIQAESDRDNEHKSAHGFIQEAVSRIVSLSNASSKERTRANVRRIIDTFGRHSTDTYLRPKAPSLARLSSTVSDTGSPASKISPRNKKIGKLETNGSKRESKARAGPDTGSSEVQIGILTAKIRILADRYAGENRNDKVNKRNLRLLLHRRQKLLKYMEKKERGSDRWQNMIEKLGLTEATWKGEIAVQ